MEDDGFRLVKPKKRKSGGGGGRKGTAFLHRHSGLDEFVALRSTINIGSIRIDTQPQLMDQLDKCCADLHDYLEQVRLAVSGLWRTSDRGPLRFREVVCFGLGSFAESITSLYQLALLRCLRTELRLTDRVVLYDPCFTEFECAALRSDAIAFHLIDTNTECRYAVDTSSATATLFFMPHMYAQHYNNVVDSNWDRLNHVVMYCNSFQHLLGVQHSGAEFGALAKLAEPAAEYTISERTVRNLFTFNDIFNNLSIHTFNKVIPT